MESLDLSSEFRRLLFEGLGEGVLLLDLDGCVLQVNEKGLEYFGVSRSETMVGRTLDWLLAEPGGKGRGRAIAMAGGNRLRWSVRSSTMGGAPRPLDVEMHQVRVDDEDRILMKVSEAKVERDAQLVDLKEEGVPRSLRIMVESTADKTGQAFFEGCVRALAELLEVPVAIIGVVDCKAEQRLRPTAYWRDERLMPCKGIDLAETPLVEVERTKGAVCVAADVRDYHPENDLLEELEAEAFIGLPISRADGSICGFFCAIDSRSRDDDTLSQAQLVMELFAGRISVEIERGKKIEHLKRKIERSELLEGISRKIRASFDQEEIVRSAISGLGLGMKADRCIIFAYHPAPIPELIVASEHVTKGVTSIGDSVIGVDGNPFLEALMGEDVVMVSHDVLEDELLEPTWELLRAQGVQSMMAVRTSYQNEVNGVLVMHQCQDECGWTPEDEDLLKAVADKVGLALGQARMLDNERLQRHELARKNRALAEAKAEADAANHAKSEFLSRMSHELRTPLNAILGFSQVMARDSLATEQQRQNLATITRSGTHLLEMINDVLEMSRIEAGEVSVDPTTFNLEDVLDSVVSMFQTRAHAGVKLKLGISPTVPVYARTDPVKLRQILINLFGNAVKFTTEGEVSLRVRAEQRYPDGVSSAWTLIASVCDTGPGIEDCDVDRIFQPFSQTEVGQRLQQGTGLGLPISRQFARLLGGDIVVESEVGRGTVVTVKVPCGEANPAELDDRRLEMNQRASGLMPRQETPRVLIVDDHEESRTWLEMLLSSIGLDPTVAENGAVALDRCEETKPSVVFMDIHMPVMDGDMAASKIRERCGDDSPLLVALTASAFLGEHDRVTDGPFDLFLAKPVHEKSLVEVFEAHLGVVFKYGGEVAREIQPKPVELKPVVSDDVPQDDSEECSDAGSEKPAADLTTSPLLAMPESWLDQLEEATARLNLAQTKDLLMEFKEEDSRAAEKLLQWCEDYQFDKLQEELREARESGYATS